MKKKISILSRIIPLPPFVHSTTSLPSFYCLRAFIPLPPQLSVVDTPGTNVILERQQRLTEEFVPQADLVLFVLSCDRALSDSEVRGRSLGY